MPLYRFLDAAYAVLVEEFRRLGMDLITAVSRVNEMIGLEAESTPEAAEPPVPSAADNTRALNELAVMMGGTTWASS